MQSFMGLAMCSLLALAMAQDGCYDVLDTHQCDCEVDEGTCDARNHIWTDQCTSCSRPECVKEFSWGCFNVAAHGCECAVSEQACEQMGAGVASWTHECWSCCHHSEWGCHVNQGRSDAGCHCDVTEGECLRVFGTDAVWTHECHVCADEDGGVQQAQSSPSSDDGDDNNALLIVLISVGCVLAVMVSAGILLVLRRKGGGGRAGKESSAVVIGSPVNP
ncbi:putative tandem protein 15 [Amphidinium carterae]